MALASAAAASVVVEAYDADAYGDTLAFRSPGPGGDWWSDAAVPTARPACEDLFTGRQYDPETLLHYFRARYYHPRLGRFLSRDPLLYADGMNLYEYCASNPLTCTDPMGAALALPVGLSLSEIAAILNSLPRF